MSQGDVSQRFYDLYEYVKMRLNDASVNLDTQPLDEIIRLLTPIKKAWDSIPESEKQKAFAQRSKLEEEGR